MTDPLLSYTSVTDKGHPPPARWVVVLHGILGTKTNWRAIARRVIAEHPTWGALLVDLRNHGESSRGFAPPHTLDAAAADVARTAASQGLVVDAMVGHSYGGKVALAYARRVAGDLGRLVVVDSLPGARPDGRGSESTLRIVDRLRALRGPFARREDLMDAIVADGHSADVAAWLAMNLDRGDAGWTLRIDPDAIHAMLDDYFARDLWPVVESPPGRVVIDVVIGEKSTVFDPADVERARLAVARNPDRVHLHIVEDAGHWVHVDAMERTSGIIAHALE